MADNPTQRAVNRSWRGNLPAATAAEMVESDSPVLRDVVKTDDLLQARVRTGCLAAHERVFKFEFCGVRNRRLRDPVFTRANQIYREPVEIFRASSAYVRALRLRSGVLLTSREKVYARD